MEVQSKKIIPVLNFSRSEERFSRYLATCTGINLKKLPLKFFTIHFFLSYRKSVPVKIFQGIVQRRAIFFFIFIFFLR